MLSFLLTFVIDIIFQTGVKHKKMMRNYLSCVCLIHVSRYLMRYQTRVKLRKYIFVVLSAKLVFGPKPTKVDQ